MGLNVFVALISCVSSPGRYLSSISVADHTGQLWLQGFNDIGQALIGMSAAELHDLQENDQDKFTEAVGNALGKIWNLSCRAKQETYQVCHISL